MDCIFCKIVHKEIPSPYVHETEDFIVINDLHPQAPIHFLVIPKIHVDEFIHMPDALLAKLTVFAKQLITTEKISSYRLINNGKGAAFIDHFHLHILGNVSKDRQL